MGTTAAAVLIHDGGFAVVNVGDSVVFEFVDGRLVQLSVDDVPAGAGALPGLPSSIVTQTLGGTERLSTIEPHLYEGDLSAGGRFMICTDGLDELRPASADRRCPRDGRRRRSEPPRCSIWPLRRAGSTT